MILVDTNVISEPTKPIGDAVVLAWLDRQPQGILCLAAISLAESLLGIESLPVGRRKQVLASALYTLTHHLFEGRILPVRRSRDNRLSKTIAFARRRGKTISIADGQIAAIAAVHGFMVATRDVSPFQAAGVPVLNPWEL